MQPKPQMTALQRRLLISWLAFLGAAVFLGVAHAWPHFRWYLAGLILVAAFVERPFTERVYRVAPTPVEFFSRHPLWKYLAVGYGIFLSVIALSLLTFAQGLAKNLSETLVFLLVGILGPLAVPLALHQLAVYQALASERQA